MAKDKPKKLRLRLPRKRMVVIAGGAVLFLTASAAAAAYFMGGVTTLLGGHAGGAYGLDCTLVDTVSFEQGDHERWVRQYVSVDGSDGMARVLTGLRVARAAAATSHADLVLIVVSDARGPKDRAHLRDNAVGARIVYTPHPARVSGMSVPYSVQYRDGPASESGAFYGDDRTLPLAKIDALTASMKKPYGCEDPAAEKAAEKKHAAKASHH